MSAYAAVISLKRNIWTTLHSCDVLLPPHTLKVFEFAHKELKSIQNFVERLDSRSRKRMNASLGRIPEAIYKFFNGVSSGNILAAFGKEESEESNIRVEQFYKDIHSLIETLKKVKEEYYSMLEEDEEEAVSSSSSRVVPKSKMVGLCDEQMRQLKEELVGGWVQNAIISVVGMAGIGKTTLAREIFEDLDIREWFDICVWVTVGNDDWRSEEITKAILAQVDPDAHQGEYEEEMVERLNESLEDKRYLIVLDDVWSFEVNNYLQNSFPDNKIGSRVLYTSRMRCAALDTSSSHLFQMRLLNEEESWHLLRVTVFDGDSCPPQLEDAGKKIANKCDGLPLTIVTVADLLSKFDQTPETLWIDVAAQKKHQLFSDAYDQISEVLYPSYKELPDEFKLGFLYMGVFPQDYKIPRSKLINLWIAEEVVKPSMDCPLDIDSSAIICLLFLDIFGLVMVYEYSTSIFPGTLSLNIKKCGLHSSWWHFCQREARKSYFFHVLDCYQDGLQENIKSQCRLSIHNNVLFALKAVHNSMEGHCASTAHSLLCLGPYSQYMVPICFGLKLLQRLDALNIRFYDFPLQVLELVKLRYFALTCNGKLPPSISKLQELQYLIVHRHLSIKSCGTPSYLPIEIWDMKELKHLQVLGCDLPDLGDDTSLEKLSSLSDVTAGSCTILNRVPNLKKLKIKIELTPDAVETLCCFDHISHLTNLESLTCAIMNPIEVVSPVSSFPCLPFSLNKLSLSGLGYPWEEMRKIASLPNLQVLKLQCNAFRGPKWEVYKNGFQRLYFLQIEGTDLVNLKGAPGSFKCLEFLSVKHCYKLEELRLGHLKNSLKIEVIDCNPLVEKDIKEIILIELGVLNTPEQLSVQSSWKS